MSAIDISVIIPTIRSGEFKKCIKNLRLTCSNSERVEILVKVDSKIMVQKCGRILQRSPFAYKILHNNTIGYNKLHIMAKQLCRFAKGDLFFMWADDFRITGDWYAEFVNTRDRYIDNIYAINTLDYIWSHAPVISREWFNLMGEVAPMPCVDSWIRDLAVGVGRYVGLSPAINATHQPGHRAMSELMKNKKQTRIARRTLRLRYKRARKKLMTGIKTAKKLIKIKAKREKMEIERSKNDPKCT